MLTTRRPWDLESTGRTTCHFVDTSQTAFELMLDTTGILLVPFRAAKGP